MKQKELIPEVQVAYRESCERFISKTEHDVNGNKDGAFKTYVFTWKGKI